MKKTNQFVVFGLGRFGTTLTKMLYDNGAEVLAIDKDEEKSTIFRRTAHMPSVPMRQTNIIWNGWASTIWTSP